jgi:hypothetical protein
MLPSKMWMLLPLMYTDQFDLKQCVCPVSLCTLHDGHTQDIIRFARTKYNLRGKKSDLNYRSINCTQGT